MSPASPSEAEGRRGRGAEGNESPRQLLPPTPLLLRSPAPLLLCSPAAALLALVVSQPAPVVPTFVDRARDAGINTLVVSGDPKEKRYLIESVGGGLAVIDYDNDGWMDLYVVNGATIESARAGNKRFSSALYRNNHDGTFTDVTAKAGVANGYWGKGALAADFNNDGFQDLYVVNYGPNILYLNNRDGTFTDVTAKAGVGDPRWSSAAAAADYDRDGDLDLFVVNYLDYDLNRLPVSGKFCSYRGIPVACGPRGLKGAGDSLYRNNGDGTFTDVSEQAGVAGREGFYGLGAAWGDYNNDGWPDLFIANDGLPVYLYQNLHNGKFQEHGEAAGMAFTIRGQTMAAMCISLGDYDNDGWPEWLTARTDASRQAWESSSKISTTTDGSTSW